MALTPRRLEPADAAEFQALRLEAFRLQEREFRFAPEDEADIPLADVAARLGRDFVVGVFDGETLVGVAGLARFAGVKVRHKALLWGMYVRAAFRGSGAADMLMSAILGHAEGLVEIVTLSVIHGNRRAVRFYERWGFAIYGVEPASVKAARLSRRSADDDETGVAHPPVADAHGVTMEDVDCGAQRRASFCICNYHVTIVGANGRVSETGDDFTRPKR